MIKKGSAGNGNLKAISNLLPRRKGKSEGEDYWGEGVEAVNSVLVQLMWKNSGRGHSK